MKSNKLGRNYEDGEVIIKQGTVGDCFYIIQEGEVEVVYESAEEEKVVAMLKESDFFGEMGIFEKDVRSCTVRAKGNAKILTMDKRSLYSSIKKDPSLAFRLLEKMSNRIRESNKHFGS